MTLKKSGFTLVEIMIVVAIIGLLAAIAIPNFVSSRATSEAVACRANARQLQTALELADISSGGAISKNNLSEEEIQADVYPEFVKSMPRCSLGYYYTDSVGNVMCDIHSVNVGRGPGAAVLSSAPIEASSSDPGTE